MRNRLRMIAVNGFPISECKDNFLFNRLKAVKKYSQAIDIFDKIVYNK